MIVRYLDPWGIIGTLRGGGGGGGRRLYFFKQALFGLSPPLRVPIRLA